jgi:hypothetical protein
MSADEIAELCKRDRFAKNYPAKMIASTIACEKASYHLSVLETIEYQAALNKGMVPSHISNRVKNEQLYMARKHILAERLQAKLAARKAK